MPEQLTKHPDVTLQVLRSAGARCGEGEPQQILRDCPAPRFCKLPGGEICVYGLPEAASMTQLKPGDWQQLAMLAAPAPATPPPAGLSDALSVAAIALLVGLVGGYLIARLFGRTR
ncbi:hypothetical protein [Piscinibacter sakaiensis]|uniref:hypothetical protein n=1 Tax=Piscinibacter sakaiensis TaxID=1547922 RepID=UPI003AACB6B5